VFCSSHPGKKGWPVGDGRETSRKSHEGLWTISLSRQRVRNRDIGMLRGAYRGEVTIFVLLLPFLLWLCMKSSSTAFCLLVPPLGPRGSLHLGGLRTVQQMLQRSLSPGSNSCFVWTLPEDTEGRYL